MKIFEFEQKLQKKNNGNVNIIYLNNLGKFHITTLNGRSCLMEVKKDKIINYNTLESLLEKSNQFSKFEIYNTFLVNISKSTDASKWLINKIVTIKQIKKVLSITDEDISKMFSYKSKAAYANSSAKNRIEKGLIAFYKLIKN